MNTKDEMIRQAISAWVDGEASAEERELAEQSIRQNETYRRYAQDLKKISKVLVRWEEESISPDLGARLQNLLEREGFSMKSLLSRFNVNFKVVGSLAVAVLALVVVTHLPYMPDRTEGRKGMEQKVAPISTPTGVETQPRGVVVDALQIMNEEARKVADQVVARQQAYAPSLEKKSLDAGTRGALRLQSQVRTGAVMREVEETSYFAPLSQAPASWQYNQTKPWNTEGYNKVEEVSFKNVTESPLSTFSIDVDTASYSNLRRFLSTDNMPPQDAVRIEEMINYFHYDYPKPEANEPFSVTTEVGTCPWKTDHQLVLVGLKGKDLDTANLPPSNLVFLIDVSGSMEDPNKLPLLQKAFAKLTNQLSDKEKVAIVTYAGAVGLVLPSTPGSEKSKILLALENLHAGGSTAGGQGIQLAYQIAKENFIKGGNNRVILATDGDFNVGASSDAEMVRLIESKRDEGIFLTVLGFGEGNLKDSKMQQIADKGNGNYFYIDTIMEAQKVLVKELGSTLFTIAKDVKLQIEFNPAQVKAYRLIGYEKRVLANEDFNNDKKDAGELGAGHTVTALYEIIPAGSQETVNGVDPLKYQQTQVTKSDEMLTVKLRYKEPDGNESKLITKTLSAPATGQVISENFRLATAVSEFGMLLRKSEFKGTANYQEILDILKGLKGEDKDGYRSELIQLIEKAKALDQATVQDIAFKN